MSIQLSSKILIPTIALMLSSCTSLMPKPYQAPQNAPTAHISYEIEPSTFFSPKVWVDSGYFERVDIQLKKSRVSKPKTIYMQFADRIGAQNITVLEANKPLWLSFEHKMVQGLGDWPMMCATKSVKVTLKPNHHYVFKAKTAVQYNNTRHLFQKAFETSCQFQIIDNQTNEIIVDTGLNTYN